ncbi:oligosaccharide flippase family protein [Duganella dendranthematis]|uniref:Oligosaccharide flippase family protein n=1 Tax=Duganella dendranthematis TaxID=2728021 RepID=A0ABX6MCL8_9BURK|nr:oligosaccharide flippase family protein [Duganella dendranthematis]QJD92077.1 oligosaccharide flippase family protein [Duganella dendranthematis]
MSSISKAFGKTLMTTMGMTVVGFISSVINARILGPEGRGLLSAALLICTLSASVAQCGMASSYVYHFGAARRFSYLRLFIFSILGVSALAAGLSAAGLQLSHAMELHQIWWLILTFAAFTASQTYLFSLTQLHSNLHFFNVLRFAQVFGNLLLLLPLLLWFKVVTFEQVMIAQLLVLIGLTVCGLWWTRENRIWALKEEPKEPVRTWMVVRYGLHQQGIGLLGIFLINFDKLFLLNRGTIKEYGYYALAFTTSRLIGAVQESVSVALFSRFAGRDEQQLSQAVRNAFRMTFMPLMTVAAIGAAVAPWALTLVYGKAFADMTIPFAILLFECVIGGSSWTLAQRFNAAGQPGLVLARQFVSIMPVLIAIPFLPHENTYVYLALLMLCGACLRLIMTIVLSVTKLKEPMPGFLPTKQDIAMVRKLLTRSK